MKATRRGVLAGLAGVVAAFGVKPTGGEPAERPSSEYVLTSRHPLGPYVEVRDRWGNVLQASSIDLRSGVAMVWAYVGGHRLRTQDGEPLREAIAGCSVAPKEGAPQWARRMLVDLRKELGK